VCFFCGVGLKYYLLFLLLFCFAPLTAAQAIGDAQVAQLAKQLTWLKLLHANAKQGQSKVRSKDFFLSAQGNLDPQAELQAALDMMYNSNQGERLQAMCRFPARFTWLGKALHINTEKDLKHCARLQRWLGNNDEISLILVSGYLGNPASTFGHALLKLYRSKDLRQDMLLDTAINYGAITPEHESPLVYVYKGLTGGYQATFLDKYYYTQDLVYSKLESRDMWEYTLNLSPEKTKFLMYHIWELLGKKLDYYFLDDNCAYQLMLLLELVIDEDVVADDMAWYVPVEGFQRLEAIDQARIKNGKPRLLKAVTFLPSSQRRLDNQLMQLNAAELNVMQALMQWDANQNVAKAIQGLPEASQQNVLDALLTFYNYELIKSGLKPSDVLKNLKQQALMARFSLPGRQHVNIAQVSLSSPTQSFKTSLLGLGVGNNDAGTYARLHAAAYFQDSTGRNQLYGDELVLFDGVLGLQQNKNVFLEKLDFIRVRKLNANPLYIQRSAWAWQMRVGLDIDDVKRNKYDVTARFGAGKTWQTSASMAWFAMGNVSLHSVFPHLRIRPHLGVYTDWGSLKSLWYFGVENNKTADKFEQVWGGEIQYHVAEQASVVFKYKDDKFRQASLEMRTFW